MITFCSFAEHSKYLAHLEVTLIKPEDATKSLLPAKIVLVRSCLLVTLIKCLKGHKSLGLLFDVQK